MTGPDSSEGAGTPGTGAPGNEAPPCDAPPSDAPGIDPPEWVVVGHVSKPHGTKGEIFIWPLTDHPDRTFAPGVELRVADGSGERPDPSVEALRVREARGYRKGTLVSFDGIHDRDAAATYHGRYLVRPFAEVEPRADDELFYHELLGLTVVTDTGEEVGEVLEVYPLRPSDLIEVSRGDGTILIPFRKELVTGWDLAARRLVISPPKGLLDL
jgi:16S rRNA processing protein RimM